MKRRRSNGKSYPIRGALPPRGWEPRTGQYVYIEGKRVRLGRMDRDGLIHFSPSVDGTFAMSPANLRQVARIANPRQPHRRVRKALKHYVRQELAGLPTQYTPAKVRVDSKGEIDIKFARPPKGAKRNPKRFKVQVKSKNPKQRYEFWTDGGDEDDIIATSLEEAARKASKKIPIRAWRDGAWGWVKGPEGQMKVPER